MQSPRTLPRTRRLLASAALAASTLVAAPAWAEGYERGPAPASAAALAAAGPYQVATYKIGASAAKPYGYGGATVHYPTAQGETFGVVVMVPGFLAFQSVYDWLVKKVASHGFVVVNMDTLEGTDLPETRAAELQGALQQVAELARSGKAPYAAVADTTRRALVGNSMGGGAVLTASTADASLKAIVALQPWHTAKSFAADASPTLIVACEKDTIAPNKQHSDPFYASLPAALPRGEIEAQGAGHLCATFLASKKQQATMTKATVAWLKRFLDQDLRYDAMVRGGISEGEFSRFVIEGF